MKKLALTLSLLSVATWQFAQANFQEAKNISEEKLIQAQAELSALQAKIADEKIPLSTELSDLEDEAIRLRAKAEEVRMLRDTRESSLLDLEKTVESLRDNNSYIANILRDYITRFESQIHLGEAPLYAEKIRTAREITDMENISDSDKFVTQLKAVETSINRIKGLLGGKRWKGQALVGEKKLVQEGNFAMVGPLVYFSSAQSDNAGIAIQNINDSDATIVNIGENTFEGIRSLTDTGKGIVPVDSSLGEAIEFMFVDDTVIEQIKKGGMVMYPILGLFGIAMLIALYKLITLSGVKQAKESDLHTILNFLKDGKKEEALKYASNVSGPVGQLLTAAVKNSDEEKEVIEEVLYEVIINAQPKLESMLTFISVTAATAPLLGLLGTVTGMIKTFKIITVVGTGDARSLSTGISEALITTQWGLIVAIPSLICHALLNRMSKGVIGSMEQAAIGFLNGLDEIRDN